MSKCPARGTGEDEQKKKKTRADSDGTEEGLIVYVATGVPGCAGAQS